MEEINHRGQIRQSVGAAVSSSRLRGCLVNTRCRRGNGLQLRTVELMIVLLFISFIAIAVLSSYLPRQITSEKSSNGSLHFDLSVPPVDKQPSITTLDINPASVVPNVLLVGAQKAGTSAVADWLFLAHNFCKAKTFRNEPNWFDKEVHFFDKKERFKHGAKFYKRRFNHCKSSDFSMDATPNYALHAIRIGNFYRELFPSLCNNCSMKTALDGRVQGLKVMMILREPISRELSWYNHKMFNMKHNSTRNLLQANHSFDEYVDEELLLKPTRFSKAGECSGALCRSLYSKLIPQWLEVIPRDQMLLLSYQELKNDPVTFMTRIEGFLGLAPHKPNEMLKRVNCKSYAEKTSLSSCRSQIKLADVFQPFNADLYALLAQNPGPPMEQSPFPEFELEGCKEDEEIS